MYIRARRVKGLHPPCGVGTRELSRPVMRTGGGAPAPETRDLHPSLQSE